MALLNSNFLKCRSDPHPALSLPAFFFSEYGTVLELRINSGGKLPNFGFVVFDDSEPVQKILSNRVRVTLRCFVTRDILTNAGSSE